MLLEMPVVYSFQILADQFAQSHERLLVRQLAEEVDFTSLDKEKFIAMLAELFKGGQVIWSSNKFIKLLVL